MRPILLLLALALLAPQSLAFHDACPATPATFTLRVLDGGFYVLGTALYQETNGHSGLQAGVLPEGCAPDTRLA